MVCSKVSQYNLWTLNYKMFKNDRFWTPIISPSLFTSSESKPDKFLILA